MSVRVAKTWVCDLCGDARTEERGTHPERYTGRVSGTVDVAIDHGVEGPGDWFLRQKFVDLCPVCCTSLVEWVRSRRNQKGVEA